MPLHVMIFYVTHSELKVGLFYKEHPQDRKSTVEWEKKGLAES